MKHLYRALLLWLEGKNPQDAPPDAAPSIDSEWLESTRTRLVRNRFRTGEMAKPVETNASPVVAEEKDVVPDREALAKLQSARKLRNTLPMASHGYGTRGTAEHWFQDRKTAELQAMNERVEKSLEITTRLYRDGRRSFEFDAPLAEAETTPESPPSVQNEWLKRLNPQQFEHLEHTSHAYLSSDDCTTADSSSVIILGNSVSAPAEAYISDEPEAEATTVDEPAVAFESCEEVDRHAALFGHYSEEFTADEYATGFMQGFEESGDEGCHSAPEEVAADASGHEVGEATETTSSNCQFAAEDMCSDAPTEACAQATTLALEDSAEQEDEASEEENCETPIQGISETSGLSDEGSQQTPEEFVEDVRAEATEENCEQSPVVLQDSEDGDDEVAELARIARRNLEKLLGLDPLSSGNHSTSHGPQSPENSFHQASVNKWNNDGDGSELVCCAAKTTISAEMMATSMMSGANPVLSDSTETMLFTDDCALPFTGEELLFIDTTVQSTPSKSGKRKSRAEKADKRSERKERKSRKKAKELTVSKQLEEPKNNPLNH